MTLAGAYGDWADGGSSLGYVGKWGWLTNLNSLGNTAFSLDYGKANDVLLSCTFNIAIVSPGNQL